MRVSAIVVASVVAAGMGASACTGYGGTVSYGVTAQLGPPIDVYGYQAGYWGDWRTSLSLWSPVVVYEYNGAYYPQPVRGARRVEVYQYHGQYFMPPQDHDWVHADKRFDYKHRPSGQDYARARPRPDHGSHP